MYDTFEECDCDCHKYPGTIMHYMACCRTCDICNKNISSGFDNHLELCKKEFDEMNPKPHWTSESTDNYKYAILSDLVCQFEDRMIKLNKSKLDIHKSLGRDKCIAHTLDFHFDATTIIDIINISRNLGLHLSLVAYDPEDVNKPLSSSIFEECWIAMGKPIDFFDLEETQGKEIKLSQRVLDNKKKREDEYKDRGWELK